MYGLPGLMRRAAGMKNRQCTKKGGRLSTRNYCTGSDSIGALTIAAKEAGVMYFGV